jgi:hypothetical protein
MHLRFALHTQASPIRRAHARQGSAKTLSAYNLIAEGRDRERELRHSETLRQNSPRLPVSRKDVVQSRYWPPLFCPPGLLTTWGANFHAG